MGLIEDRFERNILTTTYDTVFNWARRSSLWPMQFGLADFLADNPEWCADLPAFYEAKRDYFCQLLDGSRFSLLPTRSTFFQVVDYSEISDETDAELAVRWTHDIGVASIPLSVFCEQPFTGSRLRFCFAKDDATLEEAARRLSAI